MCFLGKDREWESPSRRRDLLVQEVEGQLKVSLHPCDSLKKKKSWCCAFGS